MWFEKPKWTKMPKWPKIQLAKNLKIGWRYQKWQKLLIEQEDKNEQKCQMPNCPSEQSLETKKL